MNGQCPECDATVSLTDGSEVGEIVPCPECAVDLEVAALAPVSFVLAPPVEEDWGE
jgi:alpha-aminoadipate carrier protein LysW